MSTCAVSAPLAFVFVFLLLCHAPGCVLGDGDAYNNGSFVQFNVGVILDMATWVGNVSLTCMKMAMEDFYATHANYRTRVNLISRDSVEDVVVAASAAVKLLSNDKVQAIIGPQTSVQAKFVAELGNKSQTPIISFSATSPFLASSRTPYFVRTALGDSSQAEAIAALVRSFGWRQLIPIFEDTEYGTGMIPYLVDAFQANDARVPYRSMIPLMANDDQLTAVLSDLKTMHPRVFVVHASDALTARLLVKARELGMMTEGYAWVVTYGLTDRFSLLDSDAVEAMHGVLTVKPFVSESDRHNNFSARWISKFLRDHPAAKQVQKPSVYALWAYDTAWAMALAAEIVASAAPASPSSSPQSIATANRSALTELETLASSPNGRRLLESMYDVNFDGVTGNFNLKDRQDKSSPFEIINIAGGMAKTVGFWTQDHGVSGKLDSKASLEPVVWPGNPLGAPKGLDWESGRKLRIGVPAKKGFGEFVNREWNPLTKKNGSGFCIEVFDLLMASLPYNVPYEYIPFEDHKGEMKGSYNDLVYQVFLHNFDAVVGDVTITQNRSLYVDFTVPFTELGMSMVVPIKDDRGKSAWIFLKPLTTELWLTTGAFFFFTGFVVWVLEHRINDSFRGPPLHQLGTIFYFSFSTLVFAHREKVTSNLTRAVVIVWVFVVLILTSSYTASLTSMLTVQQLHPTVTNLHDLIRRGEYIGYMGDPSMLGFLNIDKSKLKRYNSPDDYDEALSKGSARGGVGAIIDEIPYVKVFLSKYCGKYTMVGNIYRTEGFGYAFPKGSPFVADISRAILKVTAEVEKKLYRNRTTCPEQNSTQTSDSLSFNSFWGLFLLTGSTSAAALCLFIAFFLYEQRHKLISTTDSEGSVWQRLAVMAKLFDQKDESSYAFKKGHPKVEEMKKEHEHKDWVCDKSNSQSPSSDLSLSHSYCNSGTEEEESSEKKYNMHL
ncbi:glutamate receptor 2.9-like [Canna indica]|uniref:Glutamate receptor n=1 Tax=Canna indica TaxID=4628 RepID=A0AAQ3L6Z7_9LILI|nr:glutamate receptor 2.9-like [Canna indica]